MQVRVAEILEETHRRELTHVGVALTVQPFDQFKHSLELLVPILDMQAHEVSNERGGQKVLRLSVANLFIELTQSIGSAERWARFQEQLSDLTELDR
jgi:hypothetical protein